MNTIQIEIIARLVSKNGLTYGALTKGYTFEENVVFHINQLIKNNLITKRDSRYFLTAEGLIKSADLDLSNLKETKLKVMYVSFVCFYQNRYLIRSKIYNNSIFHKLPGNKPFFGEPKEIYLIRLLNDELGVDINIDRFKFQSTHLKIHKTSNEKIIFDNIMLVFDVEITEEEFTKSILKNGNKWVTFENIEKLENKWPEIDICIKNKGSEKLYDYEFKSNYNIDEVDL